MRSAATWRTASCSMQRAQKRLFARSGADSCTQVTARPVAGNYCGRALVCCSTMVTIILEGVLFIALLAVAVALVAYGVLGWTPVGNGSARRRTAGASSVRPRSRAPSTASTDPVTWCDCLAARAPVPSVTPRPSVTTPTPEITDPAADALNELRDAARRGLEHRLLAVRQPARAAHAVRRHARRRPAGRQGRRCEAHRHDRRRTPPARVPRSVGGHVHQPRPRRHRHSSRRRRCRSHAVGARAARPQPAPHGDRGVPDVHADARPDALHHRRLARQRRDQRQLRRRAAALARRLDVVRARSDARAAALSDVPQRHRVDPAHVHQAGDPPVAAGDRSAPKRSPTSSGRRRRRS